MDSESRHVVLAVGKGSLSSADGHPACTPGNPWQSVAGEDGVGGKGATAFFRKAIEQHRKAKTVVLVGPTQPYVNVMLEAGAELRLLRRVRWLDVDTGEPCPAPGPVTCFILR